MYFFMQKLHEEVKKDSMKYHLFMHSSLCWNIPWAEANGIQYRKMYRCNDDDDRCHTKD